MSHDIAHVLAHDKNIEHGRLLHIAAKIMHPVLHTIRKSTGYRTDYCVDGKQREGFRA